MQRPKALIVEDDPQMSRQLAIGLGDEFDVMTAGDRTTALALLRREEPHVILLDLGLPPSPESPEEGLRFLEELRGEATSRRVIVYTGHGQRHHVLRALSFGVRDVLSKPFDLDALKLVMHRTCWVNEAEQELALARRDTEPQDEEMIGTSPAIRQVFGSIRKVATTDVPVLLVGESGTGKELTAKALHERSGRKDGPFIPINCGAIPETLLEAELFGYEKGAFTGATHARKGKLEYAQRGTLFLDEVGEMSLALQVKLLRFLQDRTIERVGGRQPIEVDARIVAATNVDLRRALEAGTFREDLYYRLSVVTITLPPLRDRGEDAVLIAQIFFKRLCEQMRKRLKGFTKEAIRAIETYPWPGNVRELSNKVRRAVAMADGTSITPEDLDLPFDGSHVAQAVSLREARDRLEAEMIAQTLVRHDGNLSRVAEELKISRPTLYALLRKHRIRDRRSPVVERRRDGASSA
ncbi:MAG: PEP-CTERM-box response regulator transcription factor [Candidatus Rokuibacteriota bacterium]